MIIPVKSHFKPIFLKYAIVASCKKSENFHALTFHYTWKLFSAHSWLLCAQKFQNTILSPNFKSFANLVSCKKIRKVLWINFDDTWKNSLGHILGPFWKQKQFSQEKWFWSFLRLNATATSSKKSKNFGWCFWFKNPETTFFQKKIHNFLS